MAALTMTPPTRQPFASLDTLRMRPLMRSKLNRQNQQNGAAMSAKSSIFIDDSENIDPHALGVSGKRKRTIDEDDISKGSPKPLKASRMALSTRDMNFAPRLSTPSKLSLSTPKSAPILKPAGRSPPPKSIKSLSSRRSTIVKARPEPSKRGGVARPFSLATALAQGKSKAPSTPKGPASWFFDIHVDSEQEEMTNLMQHSTGVLDISDDEGKNAAADGRGKENVPPAEVGIDLPRSRQAMAMAAAAAARKASKMEEDRAPLGELNAADYYPEDCNAFSFAVVHDEPNENVPTSKKMTPPSQSIFVPPAITTSIASLLETAIPLKQTAEAIDAGNEIAESSRPAEDAS
ncbi:uncharacterized protein N7482_003097 [Penicillium canariense]|uniref:Uncharacterized protein n=1 Tax=Penicillium canariense TaxID=189055 RepID=A0A9W9IKA2_9EURO|nr:uncharacterized protein N7482_003097 [Penicillium canariense]KAJ5177220.1 hypothetical protein N7482_003097 [Penicillium canariense]